jgi:hypothetical protein
MRRPADRFILFLLVALIASVATTRAWADDPRAEARTHYQAGMKAYSGGDYKVAIREFSAAQSIAPADLNNYNLALCYDKLGDAQPAIQYYREYLNKVPNADKRAEIEASISRLDAAVKSAEAKKADEQRKIDDAKKAEEAKAAEAKKAEDAKAAAEAKKVDSVPATPTGAGAGAAAAAAAATAGTGSTGTPGTGQVYSTGDAQLDRVQGIDINSIRDQRQAGGMPGPATAAPPAGGAAAAGGAGVGVGGAGVGVGANANVNMGASAAAGAPAYPANGAQPAPNGAATSTAGGPLGPSPSDKPKETPVYKKWWFWAVVAVSAYVVYEIATQSSASQPGVKAREVPLNSTHAVPDIGPTLLRF